MDDATERLAKAVLRRAPDAAHDLKTPLNIVVLNVELLRMRLRNLAPAVASDSKVEEHCRALERESRRIAVLADAFLSVVQVPEGESPERVEAGSRFAEALRSRSFAVPSVIGPFELTAFPSRVDRAVNVTAEALGSVLQPGESSVDFTATDRGLTVRIEGPYREPKPETEKLFRFHHVDASGEPNTGFASGRLLLETLGGSFELDDDDGIARFRIELQGDQ